MGTFEMTFKVAFEGKTEWLAAKLDVTDELLRALFDAHIINQEHLWEIEQTSDKFHRVDKLCRILECQDDRKFLEFCEILTKKGQQFVVDKLRSTGKQSTDQPKNELEDELKEILEPDYGLPYFLRFISP
jgi:hypothetical protein